MRASYIIHSQIKKESFHLDKAQNCQLDYFRFRTQDQKMILANQFPLINFDLKIPSYVMPVVQWFISTENQCGPVFRFLVRYLILTVDDGLIWCILCFVSKIPFIDSKYHFFNFGCCTPICTPEGAPQGCGVQLNVFWDQAGGYQAAINKNNFRKNFSPEMHQMSPSSTVKDLPRLEILVNRKIRILAKIQAEIFIIDGTIFFSFSFW